MLHSVATRASSGPERHRLLQVGARLRPDARPLRVDLCWRSPVAEHLFVGERPVFRVGEDERLPEEIAGGLDHSRLDEALVTQPAVECFQPADPCQQHVGGGVVARGDHLRDEVAERDTQAGVEVVEDA